MLILTHMTKLGLGGTPKEITRFTVILRDKIYAGFYKKFHSRTSRGFVRLSDTAAADKIGGKLHNTYTDQLYRKSGEEVHNTQPNHLQVAK